MSVDHGPEAAEGTPNVEIARLVGVSRPTVNAWRARYVDPRRQRVKAVGQGAGARTEDSRVPLPC